MYRKQTKWLLFKNNVDLFINPAENITTSGK